MGRAVWHSCCQGHTLANGSSADFLIKAHVFRKIKFAQDVQQLALNRRKMVRTGTGAATVRTLVKQHAGTWGRKHNVRLMSPD